MQDGHKRFPMGRKMRSAYDEISSRPGIADVVIEKTHGRGVTDRLITAGLVEVIEQTDVRKLRIVKPIADRKRRREAITITAGTVPAGHGSTNLPLEVLSVPCVTCGKTEFIPCWSGSRETPCGPHYQRIVLYICRLRETYPDLDFNMFQFPQLEESS